MQIEIKIDEKCKEPKIIVMTDKMTDEVNAIRKRLSDEQPQVIAGFRAVSYTHLPKKSRVQPFDIHPEIPMADRHTFDLASHEVEEVNKKERF